MKTRAKILFSVFIASCLILNIANFSKIFAFDEETRQDETNPIPRQIPRSSRQSGTLDLGQTHPISARMPWWASLIEKNDLAEIKRSSTTNILQSLMCNKKLSCGYGWTPLHYAAMYGRYEIVVYLVEHCSAGTQVTDISGRTPLDLAKENGHTSVVEYLEPRTPAVTPPPGWSWLPKT